MQSGAAGDCGAGLFPEDPRRGGEGQGGHPQRGGPGEAGRAGQSGADRVGFKLGGADRGGLSWQLGGRAADPPPAVGGRRVKVGRNGAAGGGAGPTWWGRVTAFRRVETMLCLRRQNCRPRAGPSTTARLLKGLLARRIFFGANYFFGLLKMARLRQAAILYICSVPHTPVP